ncbi:MAG: hypothetical protein H7X71_07130 [Chitinophagales bacterium]|nr:hypothetical protein [Chitinophagales bacterium]
MKIVSAILFTFFSITFVFSQTDSSDERSTGGGKAVVLNKGSGATKPKGFVYETSLSFGAKLSTGGWGMIGDLTKRITADKDRVYYWEINFLKHPKQIKKINEYTFSTGYESPKPFVYGKQNSFFAAKAGYGNKLLLGEKAEKSGFEIKFDYVAGPSIGFIKPYYLQVWYEQDGFIFLVDEKYSAETQSLFLDATSIFGYSGFSKGFNEITIAPGVFGKAGLTFDWASYDEYVKSIEAGVGGELYFRDIPMMIIENNKPYFVYLYLNLQLGKKW